MKTIESRSVYKINFKNRKHNGYQTRPSSLRNCIHATANSMGDTNCYTSCVNLLTYKLLHIGNSSY